MLAPLYMRNKWVYVTSDGVVHLTEKEAAAQARHLENKKITKKLNQEDGVNQRVPK